LYSLQRSHFPLFDLFDHGGIVLTETYLRTDTLDLTALLRGRRKRPRDRGTAESLADYQIANLRVCCASEQGQAADARDGSGTAVLATSNDSPLLLP